MFPAVLSCCGLNETRCDPNSQQNLGALKALLTSRERRKASNHKGSCKVQVINIHRLWNCGTTLSISNLRSETLRLHGGFTRNVRLLSAKTLSLRSAQNIVGQNTGRTCWSKVLTKKAKHSKMTTNLAKLVQLGDIGTNLVQVGPAHL